MKYNYNKLFGIIAGKGLNAKKVAAMTGLTEVVFSKAKQGKSKLEIDSLLKIKTVLEINNVEELFDYELEDSDPRPPIKDNNLKPPND